MHVVVPFTTWDGAEFAGISTVKFFNGTPAGPGPHTPHGSLLAKRVGLADPVGGAVPGVPEGGAVPGVPETGEGAAVAVTLDNWHPHGSRAKLGYSGQV
jgi:hypothetical protein